MTARREHLQRVLQEVQYAIPVKECQRSLWCVNRAREAYDCEAHGMARSTLPLPYDPRRRSTVTEWKTNSRSE